MKPKKRGKLIIKRGKNLDTDKDIAFDFAGKVYNKFRDVVKAIAMFGSVTKLEATPKSDIDIIIIIDDCTINWDDELIGWYREELAKLLIANKYRKEIHINTVTLTAFWEEIRAGEPLIINILRYGEALIDVGGFFDPLKVLLSKGKIRPSAEAIFTTMQRTGQHLGRANANILNSIEGFYWAMVDASHSTLMAMNLIPPSPEHIGELLQQHVVDKKILDKKYVENYEYVRKKAKAIIHGEIKKLEGKDIQDLQEKAEAFVKELNEITKALIHNQKIIKCEVKDEPIKRF